MKFKTIGPDKNTWAMKAIGNKNEKSKNMVYLVALA